MTNLDEFNLTQLNYKLSWTELNYQELIENKLLQVK